MTKPGRLLLVVLTSGLLLVAITVGAALLLMKAYGHSLSSVRNRAHREWLLLAHHWRQRSAGYTHSGRQLYEHHCAGCHGITGSGGRGPSITQATLHKTNVDRDLFETIRSGVPGGEMPAFRALMTDEEVLQIVAHIRRFRRGGEDVIRGNRQAGEKRFRGEGCMECHSIHGQGGVSAPDLTNVALRRGPGYVREKLLEPHKDVPPEFQPIYIKTLLGDAITGVPLNEDTFSIQIRTSSGKVSSFLKSDLAACERRINASWMPSYRGVLTDSEIEDVVAYLWSLPEAE